MYIVYGPPWLSKAQKHDLLLFKDLCAQYVNKFIEDSVYTYVNLNTI